MAAAAGLASGGIVWGRVAWSGSPIHRIWAEDGLFTVCVRNKAAPRCLTEPYEGYLHLASRMIVSVVAHLPMPVWPTALSLCAAVATGLISAVYFLCLRKLGADPLWSGLGAIAVALVPVGRIEVILVVTNLPWLLLPLLPLLLLVGDSLGKWHERALLAVGVGVIGLSTGLAVAAIPLACVLAVIRRTRFQRLLAVISVATGVTQLLVLLLNPGNRTQTHGSTVRVALREWARGITGLVPGLQLDHAWPVVVLGSLGLGWFLLRRPHSAAQWSALALLGQGALTTGAATLSSGAASRYEYATAIAGVSAVAVALGASRLPPVMRILAAAATVLVWMPSVPAAPIRVAGPEWPQQLDSARRMCGSGARSATVEFSPFWFRHVQIRCDRM